jgi:HK97 family phage major capsid protein/HK97 family phage prohead protease
MTPPPSTLPKLPGYMDRIRAHLLADRGMSDAKATSTAIATATLFCRSGESPNLPVHVNAASRAEACDAVAQLRAQKAAQRTGAVLLEPKGGPVPSVTDKPWDGSSSRFTDQEYARSCVLDRGASVSNAKERYSLPVREPDGTLNRNAVHAAAQRIAQVSAPGDVVAAAARALVALYRQLGEQPPESLAKLAGAAAVAGAVAAGGSANGKSEQRDVVEERSAPEDAPPPRIVGNKLVGLVPYDTTSHDLGGWREKIAPGAARNAVKDRLVATLNHNRDRLLGRFPTTLHVEDRADGLAWECELPNGPTGQDVREAVARGDLDGTSWRMIVGRDRWEGDLRIVEEIRELRDVSVVVDPAYETTVELRSRPEPRPLIPEPAEREEEPMPDLDEHEHEKESRGEGGGGLMVEDRSATGGEGDNVETRVLDAMKAVPKGEARALTTADASAGPVTPPQLSTYLWDRLRDQAVVLASGVRVITTSNKTIKWPRLISDTTADFFDELEEITESDPGFDEWEISPKAIKALVRGSSEAFDDSDPDLLTIVRQNLETILALKLDRELLVGNAVKGFLGMTNAAGISVMDAGGAADNYDVFVKAIGVLAGLHVPGPYAIATHPWVQTHMGLLKTTIGETLQRPDGVPAFATTTQVGHDNTAGTASAIVYAPKSVAVVRRQDVEILVDRSQEFSMDAVLVRGKIRATLFLPYPQAVVRIDNLPALNPATGLDSIAEPSKATRKR